ncbi:ATP/GTP-binding protein family [Salvia divinorum]|uniref:ATP/GTP-binding protein family n=1 Tax=Salvia divinorum TaxID=28513 RepID=A0ABD1FZL4_SALDI
MKKKFWMYCLSSFSIAFGFKVLMEHQTLAMLIHYERVEKDGFSSHREVAVLYVPDILDCLPSIELWRDQWISHRKAVAERDRQKKRYKEGVGGKSILSDADEGTEFPPKDGLSSHPPAELEKDEGTNPEVKTVNESVGAEAKGEQGCKKHIFCLSSGRCHFLLIHSGITVIRILKNQILSYQCLRNPFMRCFDMKWAAVFGLSFRSCGLNLW